MIDSLPQGATWVPIPLPPEFVDFVLKNQEKIQALSLAGLFDCQDGKATVHIKSGSIYGIQLEKWTYRRQENLSTFNNLAPKHIPT